LQQGEDRSRRHGCHRQDEDVVPCRPRRGYLEEDAMSDESPCTRVRTVHADTAAVAKMKTPCLAAPAAGIGKKMPVSNVPPCSRARTVRADMDAIAKTPPVLGNGESEIDETKRKLREGYQQEADAKRQHRIQVIEAPKMSEQGPRFTRFS
jgi:hypothetical protein